MRAENRRVVAGPGGVGRAWLQQARESCFKVRETFCILIVIVVIQLCKFVKIHKTVHFKRANFAVYKLYLSKLDF